MPSFRVIDIESWERKEVYHFFRHYDNPFFGFTTEIDVSKLLEYTRSKRYSFFAAYLFASQKQVNLIPEFRYRIKGNELVEYAEISAGSTVLKTNHVFNFCYFDYLDSFHPFQQHVKERVAICSAASARLDDHDDDPAQVHYSVIPWIHFSGLSHPRNYATEDSIPKIVFGKYSETEGRTHMPVSVEAHHSIMDGYHIGLYFEGLQKSINYPETLLEG